MTCMRAHPSLNFGLLLQLTAELAALERLEKIPHRLIMVKTMSPLFSAVLDRILLNFAVKDNIHESFDDFEIRPDPITGFHGKREGYEGKNGVFIFSWLFFTRTFSYLQGTMTCMRVRNLARSDHRS